MFKTGDYVKFGKRGQVVYMVEVIGVEDTVMIRKTGPGRNRLQSAIKTSRLVLAYPVEAAIEDANHAKRMAEYEGPTFVDGVEMTEARTVEDVAENGRVTRNGFGTPMFVTTPETKEIGEKPRPMTEMEKAVTESQARQVAVAKGIDRTMTDAHSIKPQPVTPTKGRAPKGAQATKYGQAMREALARKNGNQSKARNVRFQHAARVIETDK